MDEIGDDKSSLKLVSGGGNVSLLQVLFHLNF